MNTFLLTFIMVVTTALSLHGMSFIFMGMTNIFVGAAFSNKFIPILLGGSLGLLMVGQANSSLASHVLPEKYWQKSLQIMVDIESVLYDKPHAQSVIARVKSEHDKPFPLKIKLNRYTQERFIPGDRCTVTVKLKPIRGYRNPGGRDFVGPWISKGVTAQGYVIDKQGVHCTVSDAFRRMIYQYRQRVSHTIEENISNQQIQQLLTALAVGEKSLTDDTRAILQKTGTSHLLAISGLHVGLVALFVYVLIQPIAKIGVMLKWMDSSRKIGLIVSLAVVYLYVLITGSAVSSQRAGWMYGFGVCMFLCYRHPSTLMVLLSAMFLMMVFNPFVVLDVGFWLSCSMVFMLLMMSGFVVGSLKGFLNNIHLQMRLALASFPLTLLLINQSSLISPLSNLIAIPVVSFLIVPLLLLFDSIILWWPPVAILFLKLASVVTTYLWQCLEWMSRWTGLWELSLHNPIVAASLCLSICLFICPRGLWGRALGIYFLWFALIQSPPKPSANEAWVTWLDVGQGLSTVIQTAHHTLVYDTGPQFDGFDAATFTLVPFLKHAGIHTIDTLLVSHADNDHRGGVSRVFESFRVRSVVVGQKLDDIPHHQILCDQDFSWTWDGVLFEQFAVRGLWSSSNNHSCVLKITAGNHSVLLLGDLEKEGEWALLKSGHALHSTIISVPHHGSKTSSTQALLNAVQPEFAIFSTGFLNRYHHPHPSVLKRYDAMGVKRFDTGEEGAICVRLGQDVPVGAHICAR